MWRELTESSRIAILTTFFSKESIKMADYSLLRDFGNLSVAEVVHRLTVMIRCVAADDYRSALEIYNSAKI